MAIRTYRGVSPILAPGAWIDPTALVVGDVVLAGSFTRPTTAVAGDNLHADYGPLGTVSFRFV